MKWLFVAVLFLFSCKSKDEKPNHGSQLIDISETLNKESEAYRVEADIYSKRGMTDSAIYCNRVADSLFNVSQRYTDSANAINQP